MTTYASAFVNQVVTLNRFRVRIGKKRKRVAGLLHEIARLFRRIDADRNRTNSDCLELVQTLFNAPQLGVA